ncbi:MAG: 3'-5' exonuclease [Pseudanabaenaceae cyanobacterium]
MEIPLNAEQAQIVAHLWGGVLALAPVGTGKTTVLTARLAAAIQAGIPPEQTLGLTFTNRAAREWQQRLRQLLPDTKGITVKTFHGLCASLVRAEAATLGIPRNFAIADETDSIALLQTVGVATEKEAVEFLKKLSEQKSQCPEVSALPDWLKQKLGLRADLALAYQNALQQNHTLDFEDLGMYARTALRDGEAGARWQQKYRWVQVDEVQDTTLTEYEVVRHLAIAHGNLALIGDLDQTIYEWRGAQPNALMAAFTADFRPTRYSLVYNYRSTRNLLATASQFADTFAKRHTTCQPASTTTMGPPVQHFVGKTPDAEIDWLTAQIQALVRQENLSYSQMAILVRTNKLCEFLAQSLEEQGIPCITTDTFSFLREGPTQTALAYLKLLVNPKDSTAARRILRSHFSEAEWAEFWQTTQHGDLQSSDFLNLHSFHDGEPLAHLQERYQKGKVVVFDVETTGLSPARDEIVEIAAIALHNGQPRARFHEFICPVGEVGDSASIHGWSQAHLQAQGKPAKEVLARFGEFARGGLIVGHNVGFDVAMVTAHARRVGLILPRYRWEDTWDLAQRVAPPVPNYKLETLARHFQVITQPNHHALDDAQATVELLGHFLAHLAPQSAARQGAIARYHRRLYPLAQRIADWREALGYTRPAALLDRLSQSQNWGDVAPLRDFLASRDDRALDPVTALREVLDYAALAKNSLDRIAVGENRLPVVTVHQAKGLEFEAVFLPSLNDRKFPADFNTNNPEEEKRLFYVGLTRPRRHLFLSAYGTPSDFFRWATAERPAGV